MKNHIAHRNIATVAFVLAMFSIGPLFAQTRMSIPGTAFSSAPGSGKVVVEDVAGGRRFRGGAGAQVILKAVLPRPASGSADHKVQRIVVHFRTSRLGPSLRSVQLIGSEGVSYHMETNLEGDYIAKEIDRANAWTLKPESATAIHLELQFPIGFDSPINPGEFFLTSVDVEFATPPTPPAKVPTNIDLANSSGCMNCHTVEKKLVGPALRDIAAKYKGDAGAQARLEEKVKKGSKGVWGSIQMPPNTNVRDADIKTLVQFILSLK